MTMEELLTQEEDRRSIHRGDIITGTVVFVGQDGVALDIGAKVEGLVPFSQLANEHVSIEQAQEMFKPGDKMTVCVIRIDPQNDQIVLSKKRAEQDRGWHLLQIAVEQNLPVPIKVVERVRGGLVANVEGVRIFLPASQIDLKRVDDLDKLIGEELEVKIIEFNRKRNRVIASRRELVATERAKTKSELMSKLDVGAVLEGTVAEITDFGVFVNLGGVDGLVHRSEMTHQRFNHPRDVYKVGDKVKVKILDIDNERERINLSIKALSTDPWGDISDRYQIGQRIKGIVRNLTNFGAFVEIESGLEGLIHISEMSWTKRIRHPQEMLKLGDEVEAVILRIDPNERRLSLSLRQIEPDPWAMLPAKYPPGTIVKGKVSGLTDFGIFIKLEEGIEGLIHVSELAHEKVESPSDLFKKGDEVEAVILNIDPIDQRISLSRKRLLPGGPREREDYRGGGGGDRNQSRRGGGGGGNQSHGSRPPQQRRDRSDSSANYTSSSTTDMGGKVTTKLGDVYADLFAQFGLNKKDDDKEKEGES